jgi:osmotically-inducible protein OsmY
MYRLKPFALVIVLGLLVLLDACAAERKCGLEGCTGDAQITAKVQTQLSHHPELGSNTIDVQTLNHVVYLSGLVSSGLMRQTAADVARQVSGVTRVENNVAVRN